MSAPLNFPDDRCTKCGGPGPFYPERGNPRKHHPWCKTCRRADSAARRKAEPERLRQYLVSYRAERRPSILAAKRQAATGWTPAAFEEAWVAQGGRCAICAVEMLRGGQQATSVCADHDHATGRTRALLCRRCNTALGVYERNAAAFAAYLAKFGDPQ